MKINFNIFKIKKIYLVIISIFILLIFIFIFNSDSNYSDSNYSDNSSENNIVGNNINIDNVLNIEKEEASLNKHYENNCEKSDFSNNLQYSEDFTTYLTAVSESIEYGSQPFLFDSNNIIAINELNGEKYSLDQLEEVKLFVPYIEDDKKIIFYGNYINNKLNGNCIYNVYKNDSLETILEATYNEGGLISYKKITSGITSAGVNTWNVSYRKNETIYNTGITLNYFKNNDLIIDFDFENATPDNILYVDNFHNKLKEKCILEGYYIGNTSDGYYNDNTGNALMLKFFDDSTVRMLYHGNFKNGYPNDNTGNAWNIVRNKNTNYMYYKGYFKNGSTTNNKGFIFENDLTIERINEILKQNNFKIDNIFESDFDLKLNWYDMLK